ncbi:MAG TPA: hypothetical protein PLW65_15655 [Pseudomonadota bacterium]|nr:hypothetical protein [Pseudomonadota bacterium]
MITDVFLGGRAAVRTTAAIRVAAVLTAATLTAGISPTRPLRAETGDFWASWGDGKAELSGYRLTMPRYGQPREGSLVLIYVTEDFSDSLRVKADPGRHPPSDVYPVLKLNAIRKFQTGIYDYSVMTSVFARLDFAATERPFPLRKLSLSSQEWCGHVYHQVLPQVASPTSPAQWLSTSHSYFDGEADEQRALPVPPGVAVAEDELPLLLRSYAQRREFLAPGESRTVALLPSLVRARLLHRPLAFTEATITRARAPLSHQTPAGEIQVIAYTVTIRDGDRATFKFAAAPPHRLIHYRWDSGEEATLLGSTRLPYWQLHDNGHQVLLKQLGLGLPRN